MDSYARHTVQPVIEKGARILRATGFSANTITWVAMLLGIGAGWLYYMDFPVLGVAVLWISGFFDAVDGTLARLTKPSKWGNILDITFDRVVEGTLVLSILLVHPKEYLPITLILVAILINITTFLAMGNVITNSGVKGFHYNPGILERTEAFLFFTLMMMLPNSVRGLAYLFLLLLVVTTIKHLRDVYVWLRKNNLD